MVAAQPRHPLPSISPLPPIEMPDPAEDSPLISPRQTPDSDRNCFMRRSSTSLRSQNSFTTARSSSPPDSGPLEATSPTVPSHAAASLAPPMQNLRKSLSVDSFARREAPKSGVRTKRTNTEAAMPNPIIQPSGSRDYEHRALKQATRNRGISFSTISDDNSSVMEDMDMDMWSSSRRRSSLKGKQQQPFIRPGELNLPPRMPALSTASSLSSISTAPSSPREEYRRLLSTTSMQSIPGGVANPALATLTGQTRSGSLGIKVSSDKSNLINTQPPDKDTFPVDPVTIAIVGSENCGKSTVIQKGAKHYSLKDSAVLSAPPGLLGVQAAIRYVRRIGTITSAIIDGDVTKKCPLHVLEVDIDLLGWDQPTSFPSGDLSAGAPQVDGVIICYNVTSPSSFAHVEDLLKRVRLLKLPVVVLACKSDLETIVDLDSASSLLRNHDAGLVQVSKDSDDGKERMRLSFEWLIKAIWRQRGRNDDETEAYLNPASPEKLAPCALWEPLETARSSLESSRVATPTPSSSASMHTIAQESVIDHTISLLPHQINAVPDISASNPTLVSPSRARSMTDLLSQGNPFNNAGAAIGVEQMDGSTSTSSEMLGGEDVIEAKGPEPKQSRPSQWATLDELLDKLLFLCVSGDDPHFIANFLLTYRRFSSPRKVLLAMQKRIRDLDGPSGNPMFACFAQMRICSLLSEWINMYPSDFAVRGTPGAFNGLVKAIQGKTYLLHYASDFIPFFEILATKRDQDEAWALPVEEDFDGEFDDAPSLYDEDIDEDEGVSEGSPLVQPLNSVRKLSMSQRSRDRQLSLPSTSLGQYELRVGSSHNDPIKKLLKDLVRMSQELAIMDPSHVAEEITRIEVGYFLAIEPRHWLHYTLVSGKQKSSIDSIGRFNTFSNNLADWVVSLILCHDRPKYRAKQIEQLAHIAQKLRGMNNYSALRAFVAGINNATFPGDPTIELFRTKCPELYKMFRSWDILLQAVRSHRAYRMALRSSKGASIPALEVHMSDLIRAHEGNIESSPDYPNKIHWGKFNMIGKFVNTTTLCQLQCKNTIDYNFASRPLIKQLLEHSLMDVEVQRSRIAPPPEEPYEEPPYPGPRATTRDNHLKDSSTLVRKLFSWS